MDGAEKLCFNKVLSQLSDITDKLSWGGIETTTLIIYNPVYFQAKIYYIDDTGNFASHIIDGYEDVITLDIRMHSFVCVVCSGNYQMNYQEETLLFLGAIDNVGNNPYEYLENYIATPLMNENANRAATFYGDAFLVLEDNPYLEFTND